MKRIIIVGAGASGLMAALKAAETANGKAEITVLERGLKPGKKILVTGNGRCNLTNLAVNSSYYNAPEFVEYALKCFGAPETMDYLAGKGLFYKIDEEKRVYPASNSAATIADLLIRECGKACVKFNPGVTVNKIVKEGNIFKLDTGKGTYSADAVICATGGKAGAESLAALPDYLAPFNLKRSPVRPALTPLLTPKRQIEGLAGVRAEGEIKLLISGREIYSERGEVQFREDGLSGIAVFNASLHYARSGAEKAIISIDFMPDYTEKELINNYKNLNITLPEYLLGMLPVKLANKISSDSTPKDIQGFIKKVKEMRFDIIGAADYVNAQVTAGGIALAEIDPKSLMCLRIPGLYIIGELLDVDAPCGGFNLQWAWSSGALAGESAGKTLPAKHEELE